MLTMRPFDSMTSGANAFVTRNTPYTFTCIWKSKSSSLVLRTGSATTTPALLTMPCNGRPESRTISTAAATSAGTRDIEPDAVHVRDRVQLLEVLLLARAGEHEIALGGESSVTLRPMPALAPVTSTAGRGESPAGLGSAAMAPWPRRAASIITSSILISHLHNGLVGSRRTRYRLRLGGGLVRDSCHLAIDFVGFSGSILYK